MKVLQKDIKSLSLPDPSFARKLDETIYNAIIEHLTHKLIFLNPDISLSKLSLLIGTNTTYLSNVINTYLHCNFKTLVNHYRVEYCKKLLENEEEIAMKELPVRCGFSSLSAFYAAFKKYTGISPKDYHKQFHFD